MKMKLISWCAALCALFSAAAFSACKSEKELKLPSEEHIHEYGEWETIQMPNCEEKGEKRRFCACGSFETEPIQALGHDVGDEYTIQPTCEKEGRITGTCKRCHKEFHDEPVPALGHDTVQHAKQEPTCTEKGWEAYETCTRCDYTTYKEIGALGHNLTKHAAQSPTCTEIGWDSYEACTRCSYSTKKVIDPIGHDWESTYTIDQEPTFNAEGLKSIHCKRCNATKDQKVLDKLGSDYRFQLVGKDGSVIKISCSAEISNPSGQVIKTAEFKDGICTVQLDPGDYTVKLINLPSRYKTQAAYPIKGNETFYEFVIMTSIVPGETAPKGTKYAVGDTVYDFTFTVDNITYQLSSLLQEYDLLMINFWENYCGNCKAEFPALEAAYEKYRDHVFVLGITTNPSDTQQIIDSVRETYHLTFPLVNNINVNLWTYFATGYVPTSVYISSEGVLVQLDVGGKNQSYFESIFQKYIKNDSKTSSFLQMMQKAEYLPRKDREE